MVRVHLFTARSQIKINFGEISPNALHDRGNLSGVDGAPGLGRLLAVRKRLAGVFRGSRAEVLRERVLSRWVRVRLP